MGAKPMNGSSHDERPIDTPNAARAALLRPETLPGFDPLDHLDLYALGMGYSSAEDPATLTGLRALSVSYLVSVARANPRRWRAELYQQVFPSPGGER
jgi:hypothetical protein